MARWLTAHTPTLRTGGTSARLGIPRKTANCAGSAHGQCFASCPFLELTSVLGMGDPIPASAKWDCILHAHPLEWIAELPSVWVAGGARKPSCLQATCADVALRQIKYASTREKPAVQWAHGDVWEGMHDGTTPKPSNPSQLSVWRSAQRRRSDCFGSLDSVGTVTGLDEDDELRCGYTGSRLPVGGSVKVTSGQAFIRPPTPSLDDRRVPSILLGFCCGPVKLVRF